MSRSLVFLRGMPVAFQPVRHALAAASRGPTDCPCFRWASLIGLGRWSPGAVWGSAGGSWIWFMGLADLVLELVSAMAVGLPSAPGQLKVKSLLLQSPGFCLFRDDGFSEDIADSLRFRDDRGFAQVYPQSLLTPYGTSHPALLKERKDLASPLLRITCEAGRCEGYVISSVAREQPKSTFRDCSPARPTLTPLLLLDSPSRTGNPILRLWDECYDRNGQSDHLQVTARTNLLSPSYAMLSLTWPPCSRVLSIPGRCMSSHLR